MINLRESEYFNGLSAFIKESIMQSGVDFNNEAELRFFVSNLKEEDGW